MSGPGNIPEIKRGWKTVARDRVRQIVRDTPDGPVTGADGEFLAWLLGRHPCTEEKTGCGIAFIAVGPVPGYRSRGLFVHRADGTSTDFSWRECITGSAHGTLVRKAMRQAVADQVITFKQSAAETGGLKCAACGQPVAWTDVNVDHHPLSFIAMADRYAEVCGGYDMIELTPSEEGQIGRRLEPGHEVTWVLYHQSAARLRILCVPCHRSLPRDLLNCL